MCCHSQHGLSLVSSFRCFSASLSQLEQAHNKHSTSKLTSHVKDFETERVMYFINSKYIHRYLVMTQARVWGIFESNGKIRLRPATVSNMLYHIGSIVINFGKNQGNNSDLSKRLSWYHQPCKVTVPPEMLISIVCRHLRFELGQLAWKSRVSPCGVAVAPPGDWRPNAPEASSWPFRV